MRTGVCPLCALLVSVAMAAETGTAPSSDPRPIMDVVVTGIGPDVDKAKLNGLASAVEQVVGLHVQAETLVEDDELREKILTYTAGDVTEAKILGTPWQEDGVTYVRIFARVAVDQITHRLQKNNVAIRKVDGEVFYSNVKRQIDNRESALQMLHDALQDFGPEKLVKLQVSEPALDHQDGNFATYKVQVQTLPDVSSWKTFRERILGLLKKSPPSWNMRQVAISVDRESGEDRYYGLGLPQELNDRMWNVQAKGEYYFYWLFLAQTFQEGTEPHMMRVRWEAFPIDKTASPIFVELSKKKYRLRVSLIDKRGGLMTDVEHELRMWNQDVQNLYSVRDGSWKKDSYFLAPFFWAGKYYSPSFQVANLRLTVAVADLPDLDRAEARIEEIREPGE